MQCALKLQEYRPMAVSRKHRAASAAASTNPATSMQCKAADLWLTAAVTVRLASSGFETIDLVTNVD